MNIIKVILSDSKLTTQYQFVVNVLNSQPLFSSPLKDVKVPLNTELNLTLPAIDEKEKLPVRITTTMENGLPLPQNIQFNQESQTFLILPTRRASTVPVKVCLDDKYSPPHC